MGRAAVHWRHHTPQDELLPLEALLFKETERPFEVSVYVFYSFGRSLTNFQVRMFADEGTW